MGHLFLMAAGSPATFTFGACGDFGYHLKYIFVLAAKCFLKENFIYCTDTIHVYSYIAYTIFFLKKLRRSKLTCNNCFITGISS